MIATCGNCSVWDAEGSCCALGFASIGEQGWCNQWRAICPECQDLRARVALLEGLLRKVEWVWFQYSDYISEGVCCSCWQCVDDGHAPDCEWAEAMKGKD